VRADCTDIFHTGYFVARFKEDGQQLAFGSGLALEGSLIGFISKEDVANLNLIADFLDPLTNDTALNRNTGLGHNHSTGLGVASSSGSRCGSGRRSCGSSSLCRCGRAALKCGAIFTGCADAAHVYEAGYFVAFLEEDFQKGTFCGGFTFKTCLVRLVGKQNVADLNLIANLLYPLADDTALDGDARFGHNYCICQNSSSLWT